MNFKDPVGAHQKASIPVEGLTWTDETFPNEDLSGIIFSGCTLQRVHLEQANLHQTMFINCYFDDCVFRDCYLVQTKWIQCKGSGFRVSGGQVSDILFSENNLGHFDLDQEGEMVTLAESTFEEVKFNGKGCSQDQLTVSGCKIGALYAENAVWSNCSTVFIDLSVWSLDNAHIQKSSFVQSTGTELDFSKIRFEKCNFYKSDLPGVKFRSAEGCIFAEAKLEKGNFVGANLKGSLFAKAMAPKACFDEANLEGAIFSKAILTEASFVSASAPTGVWEEADLTGANLEGINAWRGSFRNAVLDRASVANANFTEADVHGVEAALIGADMRDTRGSLEWRADLDKEATKPPSQSG